MTFCGFEDEPFSFGNLEVEVPVQHLQLDMSNRQLCIHIIGFRVYQESLVRKDKQYEHNIIYKIIMAAMLVLFILVIHWI